MGYENAVSSFTRAAALVTLILSQRVAVEMFGDSNMGQDTGSHWSSWALDLRDRNLIWGHPVFGGGDGGYGADVRGLGSTGGNFSAFNCERLATGDPLTASAIFLKSEWDAAVAFNVNAPITATGETPTAWGRYMFRSVTDALMPSGGTISGSAVYGIGTPAGTNRLFGDGRLINTKILMSAFLTAGGLGPQFFPAVRGQTAAFQFTNYTPAVNLTTTGSMQDLVLTMAANNDGIDRQLQLNRILVNQSRGAIVVCPSQWIRADRTIGAAVSPVYAAGGRTLRNIVHDMVYALALRPDCLKEQLRLGQRGVLEAGQQPTALIVNKMKGNDTGDSSAAWVYSGGTATQTGAASNTATGYAQNLEAFIRLWSDAWADAGYESDRLFFIDGAYHPQPTGSYTATQEIMSNAAAAMAANPANAAWASRLIVINGNLLTTSAEMTSLGWYKPADTAHLATAGFDGFNSRELDGLFAAAELAGNGVGRRARRYERTADIGIGADRFEDPR
jgi:hypothetical protein